MQTLLLFMLLGIHSGCNLMTAEVLDLWGGQNGVSLIRSPDKVQAYLIEQPGDHRDKLADYKMSAGPVDLTPEQKQLLETLLLDQNHYLFDVAKSCGDPVYGVRIEYSKGNERLDVLFCFQCEMLGVYLNGTSVNGEDFDPMRDELLKLFREIFPDDESLMKIQQRYEAYRQGRQPEE